jgi:GGDEF domain-containing protein
MVVNTMREVSRPEDFLGHLSGTDFLLVLPPANLSALSEKLRARLDQSMEYFYPIKDREAMGQHADRLNAKLSGLVLSDGKYDDIGQVKAELVRLKK